MTKNLKEILLILAVIAIVSFLTYGLYWIAKTVSYKLFYQDMVQTEIIEMIESECLKKTARQY